MYSGVTVVDVESDQIKNGDIQLGETKSLQGRWNKNSTKYVTPNK